MKLNKSENLQSGRKLYGRLSQKLILNIRRFTSKISCYKKGHYSLIITHKDNLAKFKNIVGFSINRKAERLK